MYDGKVASDRETAGKLMKAADEQRIIDIINGAGEHVGSDAKIATLGWCFGGGWSMQSAMLFIPNRNFNGALNTAGTRKKTACLSVNTKSWHIA